MPFAKTQSRGFNKDAPNRGENDDQVEDESSFRPPTGVNSIPRGKRSKRFPAGMQALRMEVWENGNGDRIYRLPDSTEDFPSGKWTKVGYDIGGRVSQIENARKARQRGQPYPEADLRGNVARSG